MKNSNGTPFDSSTKLSVTNSNDAPQERPILNLRGYKKVDTIEDGFVVLTQYKYRQRTQQLLFEVNEHNFDKVKNDETWGFNRTRSTEDSYNSIKLKEKMKSLLKEMQEFLDNTTVITSDSSFIKLLCDDLYICLKTFDTKHSAMFSCARQISQGAQRAYSATRTPKAPINRHVFDIENYGTPIFTRTNAGNPGNYNDNGSLISKIPDFNIDELNEDNFNKEFYQIVNDTDNDNDNDIEYNLSSTDDNPYSTLSISDLMRSCSKI